ncbi:MAG: hypothetical protein ABIJ26_00620 [Candidatus Margulisiibacteriota bacterium]|nr:hypothetical protein [Candidatus Margulisiibacteriota bacterium]
MPKGPTGREKGVRYEQSRNPDGVRGGLVRISGAFLSDHLEDVLNIVKHEEKLAFERDSNLRVDINKKNGGVEVETNCDNLAMRIGKAIHHAYKGDHSYKFRDGDRFVEVDWKRD